MPKIQATRPLLFDEYFNLLVGNIPNQINICKFEIAATMTSGHTFLELDDGPTLRLTLTNNARTLGALRPQLPSWLEDWRRKFYRIFTGAQRDANLDEENSEAARQRNAAKLDAIFDDIVAQINAARYDVQASLQNLTPEQQEDVVTFWGSAQFFFMNIVRWMQDMFQKILDKIRQGWRLVKEVVVEIFTIVEEWLGLIF